MLASQERLRSRFARLATTVGEHLARRRDRAGSRAHAAIELDRCTRKSRAD
jgi:hypothetical protein